MTRALRIFLCCQQSSQRHAVPAYAFWAEYFRGALTEAGHVCLEGPDCDWAEGLLPAIRGSAASWPDRTWRRAVDFLRREHARQPVDFFLSYLFPGQVPAGAVAEIQALGIPCVNFFCDNVREFRRIPEQFRAFDLHWVPEFKALALYQEARLPFLHAPMPCWVPPAQRTPVERELSSIAFVGTRDEIRERLFADVIQRGLAIELRGTGWETTVTKSTPPPPRSSNPFELVRRQLAFATQHGWTALWRRHSRRRPALPTIDFATYARPAPAGDDYWTALRESTVCLGVNRYPSWRFPSEQPDTYSRLRDIEAPMAGACYLTEWTQGLDQLYELGREIETYRDAAELVEKSRALAGDPPRRKRMREAAQSRALNDHAIAETIRRIAARLNLPR